uniref:Uncharacterized protein n=1 Tax=Vespula pensylvanica TaxID=30213 RepID=A0A834K6D0_VESPE|nr:hypothetical protein H0235_015979 [Vespula pensylvanica]
MPRMVSIRAGLWNRESASFIDDGIVNLSRSKTCESMAEFNLDTITLAHRMASTKPICVLASEFPIDLQLHKRREFYSGRKTGTLHRNRIQKYKQQIVTREVRRGHSNFKAKLISSSLATDEKCECGKWTRFSITFLTAKLSEFLMSHPLFPSYEISVTEHDMVSGSSWFPVDAAGVSVAIRHCGYVSRGKTARNSLLEFWVFPSPCT